MRRCIALFAASGDTQLPLEGGAEAAVILAEVETEFKLAQVTVKVLYRDAVETPYQAALQQ